MTKRDFWYPLIAGALGCTTALIGYSVLSPTMFFIVTGGLVCLVSAWAVASAWASASNRATEAFCGCRQLFTSGPCACGDPGEPREPCAPNERQYENTLDTLAQHEMCLRRNKRA